MPNKTIAYKGSALNKQYLNMGIENMESLKHACCSIAPSTLKKISSSAKSVVPVRKLNKATAAILFYNTPYLLFS